MKQNQNIFTRKNQKKKDKAYFAPKSELLAWVSSTLNLEIKSIEETQTGAIFCQLLDALHPGTVRMNKVNWKAKLETEYISNFKLFQQGLSNNNIDKPINIQRLSKGKTMELIELLQWLYGHFISLGVEINSYDALKKRNGNNFVYFEQKLNNNNVNNNKSILCFRDDISKDSSNFSDFKDFFGVKKNNERNKKNINSNINSLNANLRSNNFQTKYNIGNSIINNSNKSNLIKNKIRGKSEKVSVNSNSSFSSISPIPYQLHEQKDDFSCQMKNSLSISKNSELNNNQLNNINLNDIANSPFIIEEKPEEEEKLNSIFFEGINNIDKENILELEKHDGNNIRDLKILIRKLRVNSIIFKSNLGSILNKVTKERDFFLNKLKDIEYLYFNPIIKNSNENKNEILKSILKAPIDSTILINSEGIASIKPINNKNHFLKNSSKDDSDIINTKINSQNALKIKISISKGDKNKDEDIIMMNNINNKTQPILSDCNKKKFESNIFPLKNNCDNNNNYLSNNKQKRDINNNQENHVTPSNKTSYYDISSHILNDSLHIPNTENVNPNMKSNNNNNNNLIDFV